LIFSHNGTPFSIDDIKSITNFGGSTKSNDDSKKGKFGIGFKAVFSITGKNESLRIYSGGFAFAIENINVPKEINKIKLNANQTLFVFPFEKNREHNLFDELKDKFNELKHETILFLSHINQIIIQFDNMKIIIKKEITSKANIIRIIKTANSITDKKDFLLFHKVITLSIPEENINKKQPFPLRS
jgi:hypothetical protein